MQQVNIRQVMEKFQSKKELYDFLTQECHAHLPKIGSTNVYFYKEVARGKKEVRCNKLTAIVFKREAVKASAVPQIEELTCEDILNYAKAKPELLRYLPTERD